MDDGDIVVPGDDTDLQELAGPARSDVRSRSEVFQDALRRYFGEPVYEPTEEERRLLDEALAGLEREPAAGRSWDDVRAEIWPE